MVMRAPGRNSLRAMIASLALAGLPITPSAQVFTFTSGMPVRVEIVSSCTISASDLDFGAYNTSSTTPALGQTNIQLQCGTGVFLEVSLDAGTGPGSNTSHRRMGQESGTDRLDYDLYQDSGRTMHWGDKSGRDTREVVSTGEPQTIPVYGEIPAGQRARDGTYSDTITVQVVY